MGLLRLLWGSMGTPHHGEGVPLAGMSPFQVTWKQFTRLCDSYSTHDFSSSKLSYPMGNIHALAFMLPVVCLLTVYCNGVYGGHAHHFIKMSLPAFQNVPGKEMARSIPVSTEKALIPCAENIRQDVCPNGKL